MDGWVDRWVGGWMDGWLDGWVDELSSTQQDHKSGTI